MPGSVLSAGGRLRGRFYLVEFAQRVPTGDSSEYLVVLGLIVTEASVVPADLEPGYSVGRTRVLALALERLPDCPIDHTLRYLLAAVVAPRGRADLASALQNLDRPDAHDAADRAVAVRDRALVRILSA